MSKYKDSKNKELPLRGVQINRRYGSSDDLISAATYIGHFIIIWKELHTINYMIYCRCSSTPVDHAKTLYSSKSSDSFKRHMAKESFINSIRSIKNSEIFVDKINIIYEEIDILEKNIANFGVADGNKEDSLTLMNILGDIDLESHVGLVRNIHESSVLVYLLIQRLVNTYDSAKNL